MELGGVFFGLGIGHERGRYVISETVEILTVIGERPCQIFTEVLHDAILHIGAGVDIKNSRVEVWSF